MPKIRVNILPITIKKFFGYVLPAYNVEIDESLYNLIAHHGVPQISIIRVDAPVPSAPKAAPAVETNINPLSAPKADVPAKSTTAANQDTPKETNEGLPIKKREATEDNMKALYSDKDAFVAKIEAIKKDLRLRGKAVRRRESKAYVKDFDKEVYDVEELYRYYAIEDLQEILRRRGHNLRCTPGYTEDVLSPKASDTVINLIIKVIKSNKAA